MEPHQLVWGNLGPRNISSGSKPMGNLDETLGCSRVGSGLCLLQLSGIWFLKATVSQRRQTGEQTVVAFPHRLTCPEEGILEIRNTFMWVSPMHLFIFLSSVFCILIKEKLLPHKGYNLSILKLRTVQCGIAEVIVLRMRNQVISMENKCILNSLQ